MAVNFVEIRIKGKNTMVPCVEIQSLPVVARGGWVKIASIREEEVTAGGRVSDPAKFVAVLKQSGLRADVFTFFQRPPDVRPKFDLHLDWENYAVVPLTTFEAWWEKLPQESRKNTRRAAKRGVDVRTVIFDDALARSIHKICNETPVRQGRPFWHYGKNFETIKREHATYLERSEFIGAYFEQELIGFLKVIHVDHIAFIVAILASVAHTDKRPMNALLAQAVQMCAQGGTTYLVYDRYVYGNKKDDSLLEFKRRNGFERVDFPRYYIPLTWKGKLFVALKLYRGASGLLPAGLLRLLLKIRARFYLKIKQPRAGE